MFVILICPCVYLYKISISEMFAKISLKSGSIHNIIKNAIDIIPAIIWFSVMLDASSPNDMYARQNRKNPNNVVSAVEMCGIP